MTSSTEAPEAPAVVRPLTEAERGLACLRDAVALLEEARSKVGMAWPSLPPAAQSKINAGSLSVVIREFTEAADVDPDPEPCAACGQPGAWWAPDVVGRPVVACAEHSRRAFLTNIELHALPVPASPEGEKP